MKGILFIYLHIGLITALHAQTGYYYQTIDFSESENALLIPAETENLAKILLHGFSTGKLKAYVSAYTEEPVEWSVPEPLEEWNSNTNYFLEDMVRYNGVDYIVMIESKGKPPGDNDYWTPIDRRIPLKYKHEFPALNDTLTKSQFLRNMVLTFEQNVEEWIYTYSYFITDLIWYNGEIYEALQDSKGIPPTDTNYWQKTHRADLQFALPSEIQTAQILYSYTVVKSDTVRIPQMLSLILAGYEGNKHVASFYFQDALHYLSSVENPILYRSDYGHLKPKCFLPCVNCKYELAGFIREIIRSGKLIPDSQSIINKQQFDKWMADDNVNVPQAYQLPGSNDIWIYGSKTLSDTESVPELIAKVDVNKVITFLPNYSDKYYTYASAFQFQLFNGRRDGIDLKIPEPTIKPPVVNSIAPSKAAFYVRYSVNLSDLKIEQAESVRELWKKITGGNFSEDRFPLTQMGPEFFPIDFDWKKIKNWKSSDNSTMQFNFSVSPFRSDYAPDSLPDCNEIRTLSVCYKTSFDLATSPSQSKEPVFINFVAKCDESQRMRTYNFRFSTIEELLKSNPVFLREVNEGSLKWNNAELAYGLIEEY